MCVFLERAAQRQNFKSTIKDDERTTTAEQKGKKREGKTRMEKEKKGRLEKKINCFTFAECQGKT